MSAMDCALDKIVVLNS